MIMEDYMTGKRYVANSLSSDISSIIKTCDV